MHNQLMLKLMLSSSSSSSLQNEFDHKERRLTQQLQSTTDSLHNTEMQLKQLQGQVIQHDIMMM